MLQERSWGHLQCGVGPLDNAKASHRFATAAFFRKSGNPFAAETDRAATTATKRFRIALETNPKRVRNRAACTEAKEKDKRPAGHRPATRHRSWQTIQLG